MNTYETTTRVEEQGRVLVVGVPFAAGTEVKISISPKHRPEEKTTPAEDEGFAASRDRMRELFRTVKGFRNSPSMPRAARNE